jgi:hypothetical protein
MTPKTKTAHGMAGAKLAAITEIIAPPPHRDDISNSNANTCIAHRLSSFDAAHLVVAVVYLLCKKEQSHTTDFYFFYFCTTLYCFSLISQIRTFRVPALTYGAISHRTLELQDGFNTSQTNKEPADMYLK